MGCRQRVSCMDNMHRYFVAFLKCNKGCFFWQQCKCMFKQ
uniref:Uncharacterized protein n=1 Tax=Anguilla anguilla TaxID=7936 RepID=A0A0E9PBB8_ANGAN